MTQPASTYPRPMERMTTTPILSVVPIIVESREPIDPRSRMLLIALRRALLIMADVIAEVCELERKR